MIRKYFKFKDTLITSHKYQEKINRIPDKEKPKWLSGVHVISDIHCGVETGYLFNSKGDMETLNMGQMPLPSNAIHIDQDEQDYS